MGIEILIGALVTLAGAVAFGWMAWVSKLLIEVNNNVTGIQARLCSLEDHREIVEAFMDDVAPRKIEITRAG